MVGGGVSANSRLREKFFKNARARGVEIIFPELSLCEDNAVMIAALGQAMAAGRVKRMSGRAQRLKSLAFRAYSDFYDAGGVK